MRISLGVKLGQYGGCITAEGGLMATFSFFRLLLLS